MDGISPLILEAVTPIWGLYFLHAEAPDLGDRPLVRLVERVAAYLLLPDAAPLLRGVVWESQTVVVFPWQDIRARDARPPLDEVVDGMAQRAEAVHHILSLALCVVRGIVNQARALEWGGGGGGTQGGAPDKNQLLVAALAAGPLATRDNRMVARFSAVTPLQSYADIRAQTLGRWLSLAGKVFGVSKFRSRVVRLPFACTSAWGVGWGGGACG